MQHMSDWSTVDGSLLVHLSEDVMQVLSINVQSGGRPESGGILLGTVHERGLMVIAATQPSRLDRQFPYLFERMPFGHRAVARRRWKSSNGLVRYIGEWHTHPQDFPTPSGTDLAEWKKLAQVRLDKRAVLAVIVGRQTFHVEMMDAKGGRSIMTGQQS